MKNQTFLGSFLAFIGLLGLIVGLITGHLMDSIGQLILYILPVVLGVIMIVVDQMAKRK